MGNMSRVEFQMAFAPHCMLILWPCDDNLTAVTTTQKKIFYFAYSSVSQPPGPGINYTGPREVLLEFVILVF